jgi:lysine 2,3-aminomutase
MLDFSLSDEQMELFEKARQKGIPFFVNPYYLSLVLVRPPEHLAFADKTIRDYIFYSEDLVQEFGRISAWEKEDKVEVGKPNAAGWLLPNSRNIHRRYPEVAIFIPDSMGRACGGLCVSCQRMYDFQRGNLNFNLDKLKPNASWPERLRRLMDYFEQDTQLRDILITGGDALMSSTAALKNILDAVLDMAYRKKAANKLRPDGGKYAEIQRIRIGTRLPVYLPQRIDEDLVEMLRQFRAEALRAGIDELVIQMHFESPMELTPEALTALKKLNRTGWLLVNQQVFTAAASRRGYAARLRQMLNDVGVIPYYTFTVKGFRENRFNFAPNARSVQEMTEEKSFGYLRTLKLKDALSGAKDKAEFLKNFRAAHQLPFVATDRNVFNLPAVGKSMNFRVVGLTADGRRILMFRHDRSRKHSPSVDPDEEVFLIESKSVAAYLRQLEAMGENPEDYRGIYGYSAAFTEERADIFRYKQQSIALTPRLTNWQEVK